jgi:hypothetical protein
MSGLITPIQDLSTIKNNQKILAIFAAINNDANMQIMDDGYADAFTDENNINTGSNVGATYDGGANKYSPAGQSKLDVSGLTKIGDTTDNGGVAAAFDGDIDQISTVCAEKFTTTSAFVGVDHGSGNSETLTGVKLWGANNTGYSSSASFSLDIYGSNSAPSNPTDGTLLANIVSGQADVDNADAKEKLSGLNETTAYRYHWVTVTGSTSTTQRFAEVEFYTTNNDLTLIGTAFTMDTERNTIDILLLHDPIDSVTLNTDLKILVSRDNGTTFTEGVLSSIGPFVLDESISVLKASIDVSAQPSGTEFIWKITTHNSKDQDIYGVAASWE